MHEGNISRLTRQCTYISLQQRQSTVFNRSPFAASLSSRNAQGGCGYLSNTCKFMHQFAQSKFLHASCSCCDLRSMLWNRHPHPLRAAARRLCFNLNTKRITQEGKCEIMQGTSTESHCHQQHAWRRGQAGLPLPDFLCLQCCGMWSRHISK